MNADGGIPQPLINAAVVDRLTWSADGTEITYATTVGDVPGLQSVKITDRTVRRVPTPGPALNPIWLGDDLIAFLEPLPAGPGKPNVNRIALIHAGGEPVSTGMLHDLNLGNGFVMVSPDRRRVAAIVDPGGSPGSIWVADADGTKPFRKIAELPFDVRPRGGAWTPDASELIVGTIQRTSHLVLFDHSE
jgi:hypothetical protein